MKKDKAVDGKFIVGLLIALILILLFLFGCEPIRSGPSRLASGIGAGSNRVDTGWFAYVMDDCSVITSKGIPFEIVVGENFEFCNNGVGGVYARPIAPAGNRIEGSGVTGAGGQMVLHGVRNPAPWQGGRVIRQGAYVCHPQRTCNAADFNFTTWWPGPNYASAGGQCAVPRITPPTSNATSTSGESSASGSPTSGAPSSGFSSSGKLIQQQGEKGIGFPVEMNGAIIAGTFTTDEQYLRNSYPYMFSVTVKTSIAKDLTGISVPVRLWTNACPAGIKLMATVVSSNTEQKTHVLRTEGFLPVSSDIPVDPEVTAYDQFTPFDSEPNQWNPDQYDIRLKENWVEFADANMIDPNFPPNPDLLVDPTNPNFFVFTSRLDTTTELFPDILIPERIYQLKTIRIHPTNDYLNVEIDFADPKTIMLLTEYWLTEDKLFDINNDGIVNLSDLP